ncbi:MAG: hypothetical protein ACAI43_24760 [Phycisphaerae bacterium]|nr:hypothetical protein [Tepidisphaeraceae bacterium]
MNRMTLLAYVTQCYTTSLPPQPDPAEQPVVVIATWTGAALAVLVAIAALVVSRRRKRSWERTYGVRVCAACGASLPTTAKFCAACGGQVASGHRG